MKKIMIVSLLIFALSSITNGQQREQYSNYIMNNFVINPGVAGSYSYWNAKAGYRTQWVKMEGGPKTFFATIHGPISLPEKRRLRGGKVKPHHGLGMYIFNDVTGPLQYNGIYGSYAYHIKVTKSNYLSMGVFGGAKQLKVNTGDFKFVQTPNDKLVESGINTVLIPDVNLGLWYYGNKMFAGASANQLLQSSYRFQTTSVLSDSKLAMHYFVTGGYKFNLGYDWSFYPTLLVKFLNPAPVSIDINARFFYLNTIGLGASYRHRDAVAVTAEYLWKDWLEVGYSFDYTLNTLRKYSSNTHEIIVGVRLANKSRLICPSKYW